MKPIFLRIFQEVNTEDGRGILVSVNTPHNVRYVEFDRAMAKEYFKTIDQIREEKLNQLCL